MVKLNKKKKSVGMSFEDFRLTTTGGRISAVYLFAGTELFIADEALGHLLDLLIPKDQRSFNFDLFYGGEAESHKILTVASAYPMMGERRLVVVREFDKLSKPDLITEYIRNPLESTVLVLVSESPDYRKNPYRMIDAGNTLNCSPLYENQLPQWITQRIRKLKKNITAEAASMLAGYVGNSLYQLANEIDKLDIFTMDRTSISVDDVNHVVGVSKTFNIFELQKAIGLKDPKTALYILDRMLERGEQPFMIVVMLTRFFMTLIKLVDMSDRKLPRDQIARELKIGGFFLKDYYEYLRYHPLDMMQKRFRALIEADAVLKSTPLDGGQILAILLSKLMDIENDRNSTPEYLDIFTND
jgi:DNA polymerase III subunit delta